MNKIYFWLAGILVILIITNPNFNDFENHLPQKNAKLNETRIKLHNFFFASTYLESDEENALFHLRTYIGVFGNFFVTSEVTYTIDPLVPTPSDILKRDTSNADTVVKKKF